MDEYKKKVNSMNAYEVQKDIYRIRNILSSFFQTKDMEGDLVWNMLKALIERARELGYEIKM